MERAPAEPRAPNGTHTAVRGLRKPRHVGPRPAPGRRDSRGGLPRWLAPAAIGLVIAAGIAMIAIGLIRSGGDGETEESAGADPAEQTAPPRRLRPRPHPPKPRRLPRPRAPRRAATHRAGSPSRTVPSAPSPSAFPRDGPRARGRRRDAGGARVDRGAHRDRRGSDSRPLAFAHAAGRGFLASRSPGASVGEPRPSPSRGRPAARTIVTYSGAEEQVTFLASGGTVYALIVRVEAAPRRRSEDEADAALASFTPR